MLWTAALISCFANPAAQLLSCDPGTHVLGALSLPVMADNILIGKESLYFPPPLGQLEMFERVFSFTSGTDRARLRRTCRFMKEFILTHAISYARRNPCTPGREPSLPRRRSYSEESVRSWLRKGRQESSEKESPRRWPRRYGRRTWSPGDSSPNPSDCGS